MVLQVGDCPVQQAKGFQVRQGQGVLQVWLEGQVAHQVAHQEGLQLVALLGLAYGL